MTRILLFFGASMLLFGACVPNRKYVYLQKNDVKAKDLPIDTAVRAYDMTPFDYRIQPNDALYIIFESLTDKKFDFLQNQNTGQASGSQAFTFNSELVDPNGDINYPVINKVHVAGLTIFQVQDTLQKIANLYLEAPSVKVRLSNFRFTILGEVKNEGTIISYNNRTSIPEAIGLAGGLDDLANKRNVKLIRQVNGKAEIVYLDLLSEDFVHSPYYYVYQNDVLIVPPLQQRPYRKYFGQNLSVVLSSISIILLAITLSK